MRIMKAILIGILLCAGVGIKAQDKIQVTSFNRMETDITARVTTPRKDQNGEVCALIRIVTTIKDLMFEPMHSALRHAKTRPGKSGSMSLVGQGESPLCTISSGCCVTISIRISSIRERFMRWKSGSTMGPGKLRWTPVRSCSSCAPNQPRRISTLTMKRYRQRTDCLRLP